MPGFPDKFMPFMNPPPGSIVSSSVSGITGGIIQALRAITQRAANKEPEWRHMAPELTTGYQPKHYAHG
jgi:hydrogenase small subunit